MLKPRLLPALLAFISALPVLAQSYQTQFSAVEYDRTKGPASWHGVVDVEAATGAVNVNLPLGPGIGARGASFRPVIAGSIKLSIELTQGGQYQKFLENYWMLITDRPVGMPTSWGQCSFGPGYLELPLQGGVGRAVWVGPEGQSQVWTPTSQGSAATALLASADPLAIAGQFDSYESGCQVASTSFRTGGARLGTGGELLVALVKASKPAIAQIPAQIDNLGSPLSLDNVLTGPSYLTLPPVFLVIKGDTAYEYTYQQTVYQQATDRSMAPFPVGDLPSTLAAESSTLDSLMQPNVKAFRDYPDTYYDARGRLNAWNAFKAVYRLNRIMNRHREWIQFTYPAIGAWAAQWMVGGSPTGVSISSSSGSLTYTGMGATYEYHLVPGPMAPPIALDQTIQTRDANGTITFFEGRSDQMPLEENYQRLSPGTVTNVSTGEAVTFNYGAPPSPVTGDGTPWAYGGYHAFGPALYRPLVLTSITLPGQTMAFEWTAYGYRRNALDQPSSFGGYIQKPNIGYTGGGEAWISVPRYASFTGVTKVTETETATGTQRVTTHSRVVPVPDWNTSTGWISTNFYDAITRPDGSVQVIRFVPPLANGKTGGPSDSTADEQMQTIAHLKHQVADERYYEPLGSWQADLGQPPGAGTAFQMTVYDRWDLRSLGNPGGENFVSSTPYPTRTRVWSSQLPVVVQEESLDWDAQNLGWKTHRKLWPSSAGAATTSDYRSLAAQGQPTPTRPVAVQVSLPAVREEVRTLSRNLIEWTFNRVDTRNENHSDATMGLAPGAAASLDLPSRATTWDTAVPFSRALSQQVGGGAVLLSTQFAYAATDGPSALHLQNVHLTGTGVSATPAQVGVSAYGYDSYGYLSSITPILPSGRNWTLTQTNIGQGLAQTQTDANGLVTTLTWGAGGRLAGITPQAPEVATGFTFDADQLGVTITRGTQVSHLRYNGFGQPIREARQDASGDWTHRLTGYDLAGRKTWETGWRLLEGADNLWAASLAPDDQFFPAQDAWSEVKPVYDYLPGGQKVIEDYITINHPAVAARLVNPNSTHYTYDGQGRLVGIQKPTGEVVQIDPAVGMNGLISQQTVAPGTANQAITKQFRDELGRLITVISSPDGPTLYQSDYRYDAADRIAWVSNADPTLVTSQVRTWEYDILGRLTALVQPESGRTEYSGFTLHGKPTRTVYGKGSGQEKGVTTTFDELGRATSVISDDGTVNQSFSFDGGGIAALANGKLTTATANSVVKTLGYTGTGGLNGRLTDLTRNLDGLAPFTEKLSYDNYGNLVSRTYPDSRVQTMSNDTARGLPTSIGFGGTSLATLGYEPPSWNLNQISWANGASNSFTYDKDQKRLASVAIGLPGATEFPKTWTYKYNEVGQLSQDGEDWYSYDKLGRLVSAFVRDPFDAYQGKGSQGILQQIGYDAFGNRISLNSKTVTNWTAGAVPPVVPTPINTAKAQTYAMSVAEARGMSVTNRLPATIGGVITGALYDPQGDLKQIFKAPVTTSPVLTMTYDALGRITSLGDTGVATTQTYSYDDEGLRIKSVDSKTGMTTYDIYNESSQVIATYTKIGAGSLTWKKDIVYVGAKELAEVDNLGKTWVTYVDHLGSPRYIWNGTAPVGGKPDGVNLIVQKYLPFGETLSDPASASKFAKGFTNHEQTDPSGLIYMQARFYAPMYGRFLSPDPARDQHFEETQSWNIYSYTRNQPTMQIDPDGQLSFPWHFGITYVAARNTGHGFFASLKLAWKAMAVDFRSGSQTTQAKDTNVHAMAGTKSDGQPQTAAEAHAGTAQTIADAMKTDPKTGQPTDLPEAIHTVQDQATPLHEDQLWPGFHADEPTVKHIWQDTFPSPGTVKKAYDNTVKLLEPEKKPAAPSTTPPPTPPPPPPKKPDSPSGN